MNTFIFMLWQLYQKLSSILKQKQGKISPCFKPFKGYWILIIYKHIMNKSLHLPKKYKFNLIIKTIKQFTDNKLIYIKSNLKFKMVDYLLSGTSITIILSIEVYFHINFTGSNSYPIKGRSNYLI